MGEAFVICDLLISCFGPECFEFLYSYALCRRKDSDSSGGPLEVLAARCMLAVTAHRMRCVGSSSGWQYEKPSHAPKGKGNMDQVTLTGIDWFGVA